MMRRRDFLRMAGCGTLACTLMRGIPAWGAPARRPNFLFIVADDQAPETLRAYGNTVCDTPGIDRIAAGGMTLDGMHHMGSWSGAVCTPSRTMIMTGRTVWHIPGDGNPNAANPALVPPNLADNSLAAVFNRAGYDTFRTCKVGNSYPAANERFATVRDRTCREGTAEEGSAWHGDRVMDYLRGRDADSAPFLIYMGFSHPHDPRNGTPELLAKYGAVNAIDPLAPVNPAAPPLPANYLPAHPFHHGHPKLRDEVAVEGVMEHRSEAVVRNETGREYACIENMDREISRVLDQLVAMGELDNTYVVYTSDHGIATGRHGLMGKQNLYEHSWRVPLLVMGPGIAPGARALGNGYLLDLLPTLCDFAGITPPTTVEGQSLRGVLEGRQDTVREVLHGVYAGGTKPGMRCVKRGKWKLIKYDVLEGKVRETQLFNLEENPLELLVEHAAPEVAGLTGRTPLPHQRNLAGDPEHAEIRAELEVLLLAEQERLNDPYQLWDQ
jgi:arylsulfatase A-like enzyme